MNYECIITPQTDCIIKRIKINDWCIITPQTSKLNHGSNKNELWVQHCTTYNTNKLHYKSNRKDLLVRKIEVKIHHIQIEL